MMYPGTNQCRGYGFIEFSDPKNVQKVLDSGELKTIVIYWWLNIKMRAEKFDVYACSFVAKLLYSLQA